MRRALMLLALVAAAGLSPIACTSFSGSDTQVDATKDAGDGVTGADGSGVNAPTDGGADGQSPTPEGGLGGWFAGCGSVNASTRLFCNDFNQSSVETPVEQHGGVPTPTFETMPVKSPPTSLKFASTGSANYVRFRAAKVQTQWTLSFWVYLDGSVPVGTEFAQVLPTSSPLVLRRSAMGVLVGATTDVPVATGWVNVQLKATGTPNLTLSFNSGSALLVTLANDAPLQLDLGVITTVGSTAITFDDVIATTP